MDFSVVVVFQEEEDGNNEDDPAELWPDTIHMAVQALKTNYPSSYGEDSIGKKITR